MHAQRGEIAFPRKIGLVILAAIFCLPLFAQETSEDPQKPELGFGLDLGIGVEAFEGKSYQKLSLSPDLSIGKFGVGVDVTLHWLLEDGALVVRKEDWVPEEPTFSNVLGLYLGKFKYIRYGFKGDPLYAKFGSIEDGTIGNGFLMGNYANTLFLPERRIFGLSFDLDGSLFQFPIVGLETHVGDLSAFDVFGTRLFFRPFINTEIPILKNLQIGASLAADTDPYRYAGEEEIALAEAAGFEPDSAAALAFGGDFRQPLLSGPAFSLMLFGDLASIKAKSIGGMLGAGGRIVKVITYGAQIRFLGEGFVPVYFNSTYDINRTAKYSLIEGDLKSASFVGWFASLGTSLMEDSLIFNISLDGPFGKVDDNEENYLNYPHLAGLFAVKAGLLPGFSFDVSYDKMMLREFRDLASPQGALIKSQLNYHTGPAVISLFYQLRFTENDWKSHEISSGLSTSIQIFQTGR